MALYEQCHYIAECCFCRMFYPYSDKPLSNMAAAYPSSSNCCNKNDVLCENMEQLSDTNSNYEGFSDSPLDDSDQDENYHPDSGVREFYLNCGLSHCSF